MKSIAFRKSSRRIVKSTLTRFVSIILISFLGAGAFAGLAAISPNMKRAGDEYYDKENVMDIRMLSTYGFSDEDVKAIRNTDGVSGVMASYTVDATGSVGDKDYAFRINGLSETDYTSAPDYINQLKMIDGRWPEKDGEAIIIRPSIGLKNIVLGSTVSLDKSSNDAVSNTLGRLKYTIVGIAESPYYLSFMQGNTSVGSGTIDYVLYVSHKNFIVDDYTDMYVTVKGAKELNAFEDRYFNCTDAVVGRLKTLAERRQTLQHDRFKSDLTEAKGKYDNAQKDADKKLADAKSQLDKGAKEIEDAKKKYADGLAEYNRQKADADRRLADAKAQLDGAAANIADGEKKLADKQHEFASAESELRAARGKIDNGWTDYNKKIAELAKGKAALAENKKTLDAAQAQYDAAATTAERDTGMTMEQIESALPSMKAQLDNLKSKYDALSKLAALKAARDAAKGTPEYNELDERYKAALQSAGLTEEQAAGQIAQIGAVKAQLDTAQAQYSKLAELVSMKGILAGKWAEYNAAASKITNGEAQLAAAKQMLDSSEAEYSAKNAELESAGKQLSDAKNKLTSAKGAYQKGLKEYNVQKSEAETRIAAVKAELDNAAAKIADGEKELAKKRQEYNDKKAETHKELADAKQKIGDSESKLSDLGQPKWYVLDRNKNEAFVNYKDSTERMHDLATVFPIVFFLVAALVCLTTMTRMVDEERTLIGTFKALGYPNGKVAGRYLKYAASASLIGSILGIIVGFWLIPTIAWGAYGIAFALPKMTPAFYLGIGFMSVFATVFITTLSTGIAAKNSLRESPADLMRPKAPKSGKRVFLEYVKPVWSRLTFIQKVTVRNLGLNKKRLLMSLVGIIGCTALVVTAFGARNAVKAIMDDQFGDIFHYNVTIDFNGESSAAGLASRLSDKTYFDKSAEVLHGSAEASLKNDDKNTYNIYVISPKKAEGFTDYVTLYDPKTKENIKFTDSSAVITEKLAMNLNVGIGDTIWVKYLDENERHPVKVTGITKNYTFNYVYLGKSAYKDSFGEAPEYNQFFAIMADGHTKDEVKTYLSDVSGVEVITFTDDLMGNIRTSIKSVDNIIWILIISAGLLAFVVLYNLTNINIGERQREIATLKVLGFYDKETYSYIFRETWILSIVGCLAGLLFGIFLYRAVVTTVEPDMLLLDRDLTWQGYLGAAILTMFFTWIVDQCMKPRIKNIDMLESLKSVD
ncbi:MAG: ABC transporter permease [Clostridiales bacterium]|nr:ABC transporter permease [Clostridiales bacterium]